MPGEISEMGEERYSYRPELYLPENYAPFSAIEGEISTPVGGLFSVPRVSEEILDSAGTFWFKPDFINSCDPRANFVTNCRFEEVEEWGEGRQNSQRQVAFGNLSMNLGSGEVTIPIAYKHFEGWTEGAIHEYSANEYVNKRNTLKAKAFDPVGIWVNEEGVAFLMTHFELNVVSLDNVDWNRNPENTLREHFSIFRALEWAARISAGYVIEGDIHGDLQCKNNGYDLVSGNLRALDLESYRKIQTPEQQNVEQMFEWVNHELMCFISSIYTAGFRWGEEEEDRSQVLRSLFLEHFRSVIVHPSAGQKVYDKSFANEDSGKTYVGEIEDMLINISKLTDMDFKNYWEAAQSKRPLINGE